MALYILDTDHMSILERENDEQRTLRARLRGHPSDDIATTIVSFEEQVKGWTSHLAKAGTTNQQIARYRKLKLQLNNYCRTTVVDFDERSGEHFERLRKARARAGTMDLKIAAIALANDATLLTRNLRDFEKVPGLKVEDWTL